MPGHLGTVADGQHPPELSLGQLETEGGLDLVNHQPHGEAHTRLAVVEPRVGVPFPLGVQADGAQEALPCPQGHPVQLRPQDFFVAPDLLQQAQAKQILPTERVLNEVLAVQVEQHLSGNG